MKRLIHLLHLGILFGALAAGSSYGERPEFPEELLDSLRPAVRKDVEASLARLDSGELSPRVLGQLGMLLQAHDRFLSALAFYEEAHSMAPRAFEWTYLLGVAQEQLGDLESAREYYLAARRIDPDYPPLLLRLGDIDFDGGRWEESLQVYAALLDQFPDLALAHYGMARALQRLNRKDEAIDHLEKAVELRDSYGAAHYALAQLYRAEGALEKTQEHLQKYQQYRLRRPVIEDPLLRQIEQMKGEVGRALTLLEEGVAAGERGDLDRAIELHEEARELNPDLIQAAVNLIILYGKKGGHGDVIEQLYREVSAREPNAPKVHYNYGVAQFQEEEYAKALEAFHRVVQINPLDREALLYVARLHEMKGEFDRAEESFRRALELIPDDRETRFQLSRMLIAQNKYEAAVEQLEKLRSPRDASSTRYLFALGAAHVRAGDLETGLAVCREALERAVEFEQEDLMQSLSQEIERLESWIESRP